MSKKKMVQIKDHWEISLGLNYSEEFEYYNRLCGKEYNHRLLKKNKKFDTSSHFISYEKWKEHILFSIKNVDVHKLENYSRFLNQQVRNNDGVFTLYQTALIPFVIGLVSAVMSFYLNIFANESAINKALFPVCLLILTWFIIHVFKEIISIKDQLQYKYFYSDLKEIIDERVEELHKREGW